MPQQKPKSKLDLRREDLRKKIGALIAHLRTAQGWTTAELAERLHHSGGKPAWNDYRYVWALEKGQRAIDLEDLEVLADALQTDVQGFLVALLPTGTAIHPDEARAQVQADYQAFLQREAARLQEAMAASMTDPAFRAAISELAELSDRRRQQVRDHIRGLRKLEGAERFAFRVPSTKATPIEPIRTVEKASRGSVLKRPAGATAGIRSRKRRMAELEKDSPVRRTKQ